MEARSCVLEDSKWQRSVVGNWRDQRSLMVTSRNGKSWTEVEYVFLVDPETSSPRMKYFVFEGWNTD